jgi:hypothetical protein
MVFAEEAANAGIFSDPRSTWRKGMTLSSVMSMKSPDREGILREVERLGNGGEVNEAFLTGLGSEDLVIFEVAVIDALSFWPLPKRNNLRSALVKYGYDEQCSRRLHRCEVSGRVRISTLIELLKQK